MTVSAASAGGTPGWSYSLARGAAGIALAHVVAARERTCPWAQARQSLAAMTSHPVAANIRYSGLYQGAPAVAFVLNAASQPWCERAQRLLDERVSALTATRLAEAHRRISRADPPDMSEYDLISGLTGFGVYQLSRHGPAGMTCGVLRYLVELTQPLRMPGRTLPGWWCATGPAGRPDPRWPGGHANLGMAHGITGVLALLAAAMKRGIEVPGQAAAITRICAFLDRWRQGDSQAAWWPETISRAEHDHGTVRQPGPGRPSWCYGTPGLARAQQLAGLALGDTARTRLAEQSLAACLGDRRQLDQLASVSLCHGWAGTLQATWRVARAAQDQAGLDRAVTALRTAMDDHLARLGLPAEPGLLDGRAGIRLVQDTTARTTSPAVAWDACLLLAA